MERFESELGNVKLTEQYFERQRSESELWEEVDDENLVDKLHLSEIDELRMQPENSIPYVEVKTGGEWRRIYFEDSDIASNFFNRLDYMWKSFRQREY